MIVRRLLLEGGEPSDQVGEVHEHARPEHFEGGIALSAGITHTWVAARGGHRGRQERSVLEVGRVVVRVVERGGPLMAGQRSTAVRAEGVLELAVAEKRAGSSDRRAGKVVRVAGRLVEAVMEHQRPGLSTGSG